MLKEEQLPSMSRRSTFNYINVYNMYAPFLNDKNPLLPRVFAWTNCPNNGLMLGPIKRVQSSGSCPTLVSDGMDLKEPESSDSHHVLDDFFWYAMKRIASSIIFHLTVGSLAKTVRSKPFQSREMCCKMRGLMENFHEVFAAASLCDVGLIRCLHRKE